MTRVYLGLGSNTEREKHITAGVAALHEQFGDLVLSPIYESESVGFAGSLFFNLAVGFDTELSLEALQQSLKIIEDNYGRIRGGSKYSPRTLDIDILTFGDFISHDSAFDVPRAEILENAFVLQPLADIAPNELHPCTQKTFIEHWLAYSHHQKLWLANFQLD